MNNRILKAEERLTFAQTELKRIIKEVQNKCNHPKEYVHEGNYKPETTFCYAQPPFRVCTKCGLAETGWGIGYHTLPKTNTKMNREEALKFVKYTISEKEKCNKRKNE